MFPNPIGTCYDLSIFLYEFEAHSLYSSKVMGDVPEVLNLTQPVIPQTQPFHL